MEKRICKVYGMSCAACSATVEKSLNNLNGVSNAVVSLASEEASFEYDGKIISEDKISREIEKAGYRLVFDEDSGDSDEKARRIMKVRLTISLCFAAVLFVSSMFLHASPYIQLALCIPVIICGYSFFTNGFLNLFKGHPNMDSLVAVGSTSSFIFSLINLLFTDSNYYYFEGVATIIALVMLGKNIELKSRRKAGDSIRELMNLVPQKATVIIDGKQIETDISDIKIGDLILVHQGEKIATDGIITEGDADIDESMLTGESLPVSKHAGSAVYAATINTDNAFVYRATSIGSGTVLASIVRMVREAQNSKAPIQRIADKVAGIFVPAVMAISLVTFLAWFCTGHDLSFSLTNAVSVLVIACPCSLGLATPIAVMAATGKGANLGILFRDAQALEKLSQMKNVMFDKTGTLTNGNPEVFYYSSEETLALAAVAEQRSNHPFAKAITRAYKGNVTEEIKFSTVIPGQGVVTRCSNKKIIAGNKTLMNDNGITIAEGEPEAQVYIAVDDKYIGCIVIKDSLRKEAAEVVSVLENNGLKVHMLTGDNQITADEIAEECGIENVHAQMLPNDKLSFIENTGKNIMVGDGINDAPALEKADIGIAMGSANDVAVKSADVVIVRNNLKSVYTAIRLSKAAVKNIKLSLFWAFFYNALGIPVAAGILTLFKGPSLNPMLCALCMSLSSISVVLNALRLRKFSEEEKNHIQH